MIAPLQEALALLNLQPGQPIRTTVNGQEVEVRVLEKAQGDEPSHLTDQEVLDLWLTVPPSSQSKTLTVRIGEPRLPSPYHLDESDLAPERFTPHHC